MSHNPTACDDQWCTRELQPHTEALRSYLSRAFPTVRDPESIAQEALVRVWRAATQGPVTHPRALLFTAARRLAIDECRRDQIIAFDSFTESNSLSVCTEERSPADTTAHSQEITLLHQAIAQLPPRCREILTLRKLHNLSQREIATRLRITENTVETQIALGMKRCAEFLARHGLP